jgi:short-subunit dehydrogenase
MEMKEAQQAFDINVFSQLDLLKLALPKLRAAKGRVVATTSGVTKIPIPGWAAYCRYHHPIIHDTNIN